MSLEPDLPQILRGLRIFEDNLRNSVRLIRNYETELQRYERERSEKGVIQKQQELQNEEIVKVKRDEPAEESHLNEESKDGKVIRTETEANEIIPLPTLEGEVTPRPRRSQSDERSQRLSAVTNTQRTKKMFGMMVGILQSTKKISADEQEKLQRRKEMEEKAQAKIEADRKKENRRTEIELTELLSHEKDRQQRLEEAIPIYKKWLFQLKFQRYQKSLSGFRCTPTDPPIFFAARNAMWTEDTSNPPTLPIIPMESMPPCPTIEDVLRGEDRSEEEAKITSEETKNRDENGTTEEKTTDEVTLDDKKEGENKGEGLEKNEPQGEMKEDQEKENVHTPPHEKENSTPDPEQTGIPDSLEQEVPEYD
ncbi:hypothetical protein BLNAU_6375 [Blattamonas nauphoetae]|uniref:Pinin/SDK/MemA protein domain-containing protein n=1 Tax=Blattamonas nauphoetae TaxID=2049346 RepID=A0ABQ9Y4F9_9EUKA|nr:hypothetical protein BLNAU_6375 [Blattamonas nauphoetae]